MKTIKLLKLIVKINILRILDKEIKIDYKRCKLSNKLSKYIYKIKAYQ
jgi:hypothetical protein